MGRLMECETERAAADLTSCAKEFALKYGCNVLMKSHYSAVVSPAGVIRYNDSGNEALAKGGSGDVLAGLIAGLMAQKVKPFDAASLGAYLLGVSAEEVICFLRNRFAGATDIIDVISTEIQ
jgi:NAD(P)H-hydrate epimerase